MKAERRHPHTGIELGGRRATDIPFVFTENEWEDHKASDTENFETIHKFNKDLNDTLNKYIVSDMAWKKENQPALDNMKDLSEGKKLLFKGAITLATLGAGIEGISIIKNFFFHK